LKKYSILTLYRITALVWVFLGALGSLYLTLHAGRNNPSVLLISVFVVWVLSPFAAFVIANIITKKWPQPARLILYRLSLALTPGSLACYSGLLSVPGQKTAFMFLIVPLVSWLLIGVFILTTRAKLQKMQ
jgi:hypothetical protein